jgi:hypothetical protein
VKSLEFLEESWLKSLQNISEVSKQEVHVSEFASQILLLSNVLLEPKLYQVLLFKIGGQAVDKRRLGEFEIATSIDNSYVCRVHIVEGTTKLDNLNLLFTVLSEQVSSVSLEDDVSNDCFALTHDLIAVLEEGQINERIVNRWLGLVEPLISVSNFVVIIRDPEVLQQETNSFGKTTDGPVGQHNLLIHICKIQYYIDSVVHQPINQGVVEYG